MLSIIYESMIYNLAHVPTLKAMDSFQDTNIEVRSRPFVVVDVIEVELDVLPFAEAYDHPNVVVFDPKELGWADLNLKRNNKWYKILVLEITLIN